MAQTFKHLLLLTAVIAPLGCFGFTQVNYNALCDFYVDGVYYTINPDKKTVSVCHNATTSAELALIRDTSSPKDFYRGTVTIPSSIEYEGTEYRVTAIGFYAFAGNTQLTGVRIPESVNAIWTSAFASCSGLVEAYLPDGIEMIAPGAFDKCTSLGDTGIPSGLTHLEYRAFGPVEFGNVELPISITSITGFPDCTRIKFGKYDNATYNDPVFNHVQTGSETPSIIENGGPRLKEIVLPEGIFQMNEYSVCVSALERIVLPETEGVLVYAPAIAGCTNLREFVSMSPTPPDCNMNLIYGNSATETADEIETRFGWLDDYSGVTLIVPEGSETAYSESPVWRKFPNIRGIKDIGDYVMASIETLTPDRNNDEAVITAGEGHIEITATSGTLAEVYTSTGITVRRIHTSTETSSIQLAQGLYVVKAGTTTKKVFVR